MTNENAAELAFFKRELQSKGAIKQLRREEKVPCVVYSKGGECTHGYVQKADVKAVLRTLQQGFLPTKIFNMKDEAGKAVRCIVKDIQYAPTTYDILHIDFLRLEKEIKVEVKVPVEFTGGADCVGVKAGGFLRQLLRHVPVRCLPQDIPTFFQIDVRDLEIGKNKRVGDVALPKGVELRIKPEDVLVTVVK